jgi:hypothetical protein
MLESGIIPALICIIFLGVFGLYTAKLLIDFKLNHPAVHNMSISISFASFRHNNPILGVMLAIFWAVLSFARFCLRVPSSSPLPELYVYHLSVLLILPISVFISRGLNCCPDSRLCRLCRTTACVQYICFSYSLLPLSYCLYPGRWIA